MLKWVWQGISAQHLKTLLLLDALSLLSGKRQRFRKKGAAHHTHKKQSSCSQIEIFSSWCSQVEGQKAASDLYNLSWQTKEISLSILAPFERPCTFGTLKCFVGQETSKMTGKRSEAPWWRKIHWSIYLCQRVQLTAPFLLSQAKTMLF